MKIVAFIGHHNSGKTTVIERVVEYFKNKGVKVCYIKHDPKGHGITDKEGSDTWRIFKRIDKVALLSPDRITVWERKEENLNYLIERYFSECELVILEGFKSLKDVPKIAIGDIEAENIILRLKNPEEYKEAIKKLEELLNKNLK